ncbi:hypothetical protein SAMN05421773_101678 [Streptomyces aidingensis]|uniref:Uncharacterized protein n=1 Tax=Streptomyces aidingensis TaxID=910347 RepID=A0A1I1FCD8_9ACTN|nr:hypothetical protein SAMN05421773_101678 [Streptomyces aidingensis]
MKLLLPALGQSVTALGTLAALGYLVLTGPGSLAALLPAVVALYDRRSLCDGPGPAAHSSRAETNSLRKMPYGSISAASRRKSGIRW